MKQKKKQKAVKELTRLNPLNDFLFKQYMGTEECKICLVSFVNAVLNLSFTEDEIRILEGKEVYSETIDGKLGRLDIFAVAENTIQINVEAQVLNKGNMSDRTAFYNGRLFTAGINSGKDYIELKKTISINLLGYNMHEHEEFHTVFMYRSDKHPELVLTDKIEIHFIELLKFYKNLKFDINNPLHRWLKFFDKKISGKELKELMEMDEAISVAEERMRRALANVEELRRYHAAEDAEREYVSAINYAMRKGLAEGREEGEARFAKLIMLLLEENRQEEVIAVSQNGELREQYYEEFKI